LRGQTEEQPGPLSGPPGSNLARTIPFPYCYSGRGG